MKSPLYYSSSPNVNYHYLAILSEVKIEICLPTPCKDLWMAKNIVVGRPQRMIKEWTNIREYGQLKWNAECRGQWRSMIALPIVVVWSVTTMMLQI